jgi:hypothetical protein
MPNTLASLARLWLSLRREGSSANGSSASGS